MSPTRMTTPVGLRGTFVVFLLFFFFFLLLFFFFLLFFLLLFFFIYMSRRHRMLGRLLVHRPKTQNSLIKD